MKKLLSIMASLAIVTTSASSVVSCGPKIDPNVILLLPGDVMANGSKVQKAYTQIVEDFDNTEDMKNSDVKVKAIWEPENAVQQRSSSFQELPDLYVENGDETAQFAYDFQAGDQVRNMADTIGETDKQIADEYWNPSFDELGKSASIDNKSQQVLSLSLIKSFDLSVVNMKMLNELLSICGVDVSNIDKGNKTGIFDNQDLMNQIKNNQAIQSLETQIKTSWESLSSIPDSTNQVRAFFKSDANVLALSTLYSKIYAIGRNMGSVVNMWAQEGISNKNRLFPIGIDDIPNKMMYEYADELRDKNLDISNNKDNFLYSVSGINPDKGKMNILINNSETAGHGYSNTESFFNKVNDLRVNPNDTDKLQAWTGSMVIGRIDGKTYTSNYFNQGDMIEASSSSAGSWAFSSKSKDSRSSFAKSDLVTVGGASGTGISYNFVSQGPQLAGFKSTGNNAGKKEKVVTKFVNYLREPEVLNKLALLSGYIPATKSALGTFIPYVDGTKTDKQFPYAKDPILTDFLNTYATYTTDGTQHKGALADETNFISVQPNPAGGMIRSSIQDIMLNYVLAGKATISQMFRSSKNLYSMKYYIENNLLPDEFNAASVSYINN